MDGRSRSPSSAPRVSDPLGSLLAIWHRTAFSAFYRGEDKGLFVLLSRTQAGPGRKAKQGQKEISRNHIEIRNIFSRLCSSRGSTNHRNKQEARNRLPHELASRNGGVADINIIVKQSNSKKPLSLSPGDLSPPASSDSDEEGRWDAAAAPATAADGPSFEGRMIQPSSHGSWRWERARERERERRKEWPLSSCLSDAR